MDNHKERNHLIILKSRVKSLQEELEAAVRAGKVSDERIKALREGSNAIQANSLERLQELTTKFNAEIAEQQRQIQLSQDVLDKKKEERQALMSYLTGLDLEERSLEDLREFEWDSLQRIAENLHKPKEDLLVQNQKAERLKEVIQDTKSLLSRFNEAATSTSLVRDRFVGAFDVVKEQSENWSSSLSIQKDRMNKLQRDNERLNVLLRQCVTASENMTDYITKNVQAKCQSFLNCESPHELLDGLKKFKARQDKVIKILKHKDDTLGSETNRLEVAKDQTHDQLKFYLNLIADRRTVSLDRILGSEMMTQLPASGA